jgi:sulfotransferase family protein
VSSSTAQTAGFRPPPFPLPVRGALGGWRVLERVGLARSALDEVSLVAAARRTSGLHDFVDESFRDPLRRLLASLEKEARLHPLGRMLLRQSLVRALVNRLRLEDLSTRHPAIREQPVEAPVFIVGLQRTGTTLLHRLLTCEPALRPLLSWEALNPAPFPATTGRRRARPGRDPRMRLAETAERGLRYLAPDFFAIHPVEAHAPEEDVLLLDLTFVSPTADATLRVPSYSAWLRDTDQRPAYRYFRRLIQLLLWQRPGRWLGKTPHHLENLDALLDVFPDAKILATHRDPARVVASFCSMMAHGRAIFSEQVDARELGAELADRAVRSVTRAMATRGRATPGSFHDVAYADLVADPMKEIRRIYDFLGLSLAPATETSMHRWLGANPQDKRGVHRYRLEDFGLDAGELERRFEPYRSRFGVSRE